MSDDLDYDDDLDTLDDDTDDAYVRIKKSDLTKVRKQAKKAGTAERDLAAFRQRDAIRQAGFKGLSDRQMSVLAAEAGDDHSAETLRKIATDLGWALPDEEADPEQAQVDKEIGEQEQAAAVSSGAPPVNTTGQQTAEQVNEWPTDRLMRLGEQHPLVYDAVLRGEPITVPAGFN